MSVPEVVYAIESCALGVDGASMWIQAATAYPVDHPAVVAHPLKFRPPDRADEDREHARRVVESANDETPTRRGRQARG